MNVHVDIGKDIDLNIDFDVDIGTDLRSTCLCPFA